MRLKNAMRRRKNEPGNHQDLGQYFSGTISVVSYNIHRFVGIDRRFDPERVARVIHDCRAEIVGLQEIDTHFYRNGNQVECLARTTGLEVVHGPTRRNENGHYGNALLTSLPVSEVRRIDLSVGGGREPRGALDVDLLIKGQKVRVIVAHLGLNIFERRIQVKRLLDIFCAERDRMEIMLGDFNEWIPVGKPLCWVNSFFGKPPSFRTFPSFMPVLPLDRIWLRPLDALIGMSVCRTSLSRVASDHLPVKAVVVPGGKPEIGCAC